MTTLCQGLPSMRNSKNRPKKKASSPKKPEVRPELFKQFPKEIEMVLGHYNLNQETLTEEALGWHLLKFVQEETQACTLSTTGGDLQYQLCYIIKYRYKPGTIRGQ
jgi:hypothetical protein